MFRMVGLVQVAAAGYILGLFCQFGPFFEVGFEL